MLRRVALASLALVGACPAQAAWLEARTPHFVIYSEQRRDDLERYADQLERYDQAVRPFFHLDDPPLNDNGKLRIYVMRSQDAVASLVRNDNVAGFYASRPSGARAWVHREEASSPNQMGAQTVFQHEYLHHLMLQNSDVALPMWVTEGVAELFGTAQVKKDGSVVIGYAPQYRAWEITQLTSLPLTAMVGNTRDKLDGEDIAQIYARGWLLAHFLMFTPERRGQLDRYISLIQQGKTALASAREAFGDLDALRRDLDHYLEKPRLSGIVVPANKIHPGPVTIRELGPGEAAAVALAMRSEAGVNKQTAPAVLSAARKAAAAFPNDPDVLAALAEAEQDSDHDAEAIAAADKALALRPAMLKALVMKSRALLSQARKNPSAADFRAIRRTIGSANRLDPDSAEPLLLFYRTYGAQKIAPTPNAVDGLYYAQKLVPQDDGLRFFAVRQLAVDNHLPQAAQLFGALAYAPHAGKKRAQLQAIMDALQAGNRQSALTLMDALSAEQENERKAAHNNVGESSSTPSALSN